MAAQYELGAYYMLIDATEATKWFLKAAQQGHPAAQ